MLLGVQINVEMSDDLMEKGSTRNEFDNLCFKCMGVTRDRIGKFVTKNRNRNLYKSFGFLHLLSLSTWCIGTTAPPLRAKQPVTNTQKDSSPSTFVSDRSNFTKYRGISCNITSPICA